MKAGPKEQSLRQQREETTRPRGHVRLAKMVEDFPAAIRESLQDVKCTIDHSVEGAIPKDLCAICSPHPKTEVTATTVEVEKPRDWRIPKGMSTEEGEAMLAKRDADKVAKNKEALEKLAETQRNELIRVNALREKNGLPGLPEKYFRQMKTDPAKNDKRFARATLEPNGDTTMKNGTKDTKAVKKATAKAPEKAAGAVAAGKASRTAKKASKATDKPAKGSRKGAFTPEVTSMVMAMLKKGTTVQAIIEAAKWEKAADPVRRVNRFVSDVAEGELKTKVSKEGRGSEAVFHVK